MGPDSGDSNPVASASLEDPPSNRSFFRRFPFPIRQRKRNVADFHIRPADPHRKYSAGDHVCGAVILTILKPIRITHLTVALHGYVRVHRSPNAAAIETVVNPAEVPTQGRSSLKYLGNGFASLFQDEQVLSADGRLETGKYEFNFDLLFPDAGLPSSIDFERGTISYMITATLTRPTPISPTVSCECKIRLVEKLDIGLLTPPRARTIYLEPLPKKTRRKKYAGSEKGPAAAADSAEAASDMDSTRANENSTEGSASAVGDDLGQDAPNHPRSPVSSDVRSEVSGESGATGSTGLSRSGDHSNAREPGTPHAGGNRLSTVEDRTITATIELLKGGCLPGDTIPVKISVQHIKRIKSMHGVIVTLFRQGRIDSSPPVSLFRKLSGGREKDDYFPSSRTGLGGLSFSSAGSCSVFRKDLSQVFSPLIIDPVTLTASVTTSLRVPVDAFPTIKDVPGEMITFKYHLEVIVDLGGKLASQIQSNQSSAPRVGSLGAPPAIPLTSNPYEGGAASLASWGGGGNIIDTDRLRREKGVISVAFELVVGTMDSQRQRGRGMSRRPASTYTQHIPESVISEGAAEGRPGRQSALESVGHGQPEYGSFPADPPEQYPYYSSPEPAAPVYIPPPEIPDSTGLTDKERIQQAEQRLLPSQPTEDSVAGPSSLSLLDGANIYDAEDEQQAGPSQPPATSTCGQHDTSDSPSAPTLEELSSSTDAPSTGDKQELERLRLLAEASAPPEFPEDCESGPVAGPSSPSTAATAPASLEPSAPPLNDDDEYGHQNSSSHSSTPPEPLPRYER